MGTYMTYLDETSAGVVALLLDDLAPPRLGTLLRGARRTRGLSRREVAHRVGTTPAELRRYERGDAPVPPSLVADLAECYGSALTDQLATRAPIAVDDGRMVVGDAVAAIDTDDADAVLAKYVDLVSASAARAARRADRVAHRRSGRAVGCDRPRRR